MSKRRSGGRALAALLICAVIAALVLVPSPANAASKPKVSIKSPTSTVTENCTIKISGTVSKNSRGAKVTLQRKQGSATWKSIKSTKVSQKKSYNFSLKVPLGASYYRAVVAKTKKIKTATSKTNKVTASWASLPATSAHTISTGINQILADTNAFRATHHKPALKLRSPLNTVAGAWAKHMHDSCTFKHNPSYSKQIPKGWTRAGENIAAGQTDSSVVQAWINSPGHRANLLGNFTHIGIGYFTGPNRYHTYFVQDFAKY